MASPYSQGFYELDEELNLKKVHKPDVIDYGLENFAITEDVLEQRGGSVVYTDDNGKRWHLPPGQSSFAEQGPLGPERVDREVVTERDLFNCNGSFYELPARNAGGFAKIRPICTHNLRVKDYCSYRGMLILTGVEADFPIENEHIIVSDDQKVALWAGVVDDLWKLGKPVGVGGPWSDTEVEAGKPSEPYLMTGYDKKRAVLSHGSSTPVTFTVQVDIDGVGTWVDYKSVTIEPGSQHTEEFPAGFSAYWVRTVCSSDTTATVSYIYE